MGAEDEGTPPAIRNWPIRSRRLFLKRKSRELSGDPVSSFEITVDGQLLFSKLESGGFPEDKEILEALSNYKEGEKVEQVTNIQFPGCTIL
ncbi:MIEN1 [Branchiostoma lanceolatum]|uniref:MIEN1 protein n=1 Tax=Branchiostoma lanceolatum TaxID=7740 RepID=A0A8J9ZDW9_BRALA|nr:MIEN1 [Branchiostoma lanceolatum]